MRRIATLIGAVVAMVPASGAAQAQSLPPVPGQPAGPGLGAQNPAVKNPGDATDRDIAAATDEEAEREREQQAKKHDLHAVPAKQSDVVVGRDVADVDGVPIGKIDSVGPDGAVVETATAKVRVPYDAFGKTRAGLILGITKQQFDKVASAAVAAPGTPPAGNN